MSESGKSLKHPGEKVTKYEVEKARQQVMEALARYNMLVQLLEESYQK